VLLFFDHMTFVVTDSRRMYELEEEVEEMKPSLKEVESLNIFEVRPRIPMSSHSFIVGVLRAPREILVGLLLLELLVSRAVLLPTPP